jgi:hypothetical protein
MKVKYETKQKKTQVIGAALSDWPWFEKFDQMFGGTTNINGIANAIDQGVHNLHSHFEVHTFEVSDDDVTHGTQEHYNPPKQTPIFGHGNEEEVHPPSIGSDILRTRACKLLGVKSKTNKKMENMICL